MGLSTDGQDETNKARLDALSNALDAHRKGTTPKPGSAGSTPSPNVGQAASVGFRVLTELVASVAVGGIIGWSIDRGLGSSPIALILFIGLGTAAGFWNVYRIAAKPTGRPGGVS